MQTNFQIISSLLDTDLYKLTMMQVVLHHFPDTQVEYAFHCRTKNIDWRPYAEAIRHEINQLCELKFHASELDYLKKFSFFKKDFIEFLHSFQLNKNFISISVDPEFRLVIKGPWLQTILFEVPVLAIMSEVYYRHRAVSDVLKRGEQRLAEKIAFLKNQTDIENFVFAEFGTRRRFSFAWQQQVIEALRKEVKHYLGGTSNVYFAQKYDLKPIGTMAHEYIQACQVLAPSLADSQKFAFEKWYQEYQGELGIVLSDTYTLAVFLRDFDFNFCKIFNGVRQDSGDPIQWGERVLAHYEKMQIDPHTKTLVFSDSLNFKRAIEIYRHFKGRINLMFGIGTHLTNDMGDKAIEIVIKMVSCNNKPVAKISDAPGKTLCQDEKYLSHLKQVLNIQ